MHYKIYTGGIPSDLRNLENKSDEEILKIIRNVIAGTSSTVGYQKGRAQSEISIGLGMLNGKVDEQAISEWVKNGDPSIFPWDIYNEDP